MIVQNFIVPATPTAIITSPSLEVGDYYGQAIIAAKWENGNGGQPTFAITPQSPAAITADTGRLFGESLQAQDSPTPTLPLSSLQWTPTPFGTPQPCSALGVIAFEFSVTTAGPVALTGVLYEPNGDAVAVDAALTITKKTRIV